MAMWSAPELQFPQQRGVFARPEVRPQSVPDQSDTRSGQLGMMQRVDRSLRLREAANLQCTVPAVPLGLRTAETPLSSL